MKATEAAHALGMSIHDFGQAAIGWLEELQLHQTRVLLLEEHLSASAFAERVHINKSTANKIFQSVRPRRELSSRCVRVPASALTSYMMNKKIPQAKEETE